MVVQLLKMLKNYQIVNSRFIKMMKSGAVEEVKKLLELDLHDSLPIMRAHGVPEIKKYLTNEISSKEIDKIKKISKTERTLQHMLNAETLNVH